MPTEAPNQPPNPNWEQRIRDAGANLEEDVRRLIAYVNDEVVPDLRRNGSEALRAAAAELQKLAQRMDECNNPPKP